MKQDTPRAIGVLRRTYSDGVSELGETQVYRDAHGLPLLYVRTEHRQGRPAPEHLFVAGRDRLVYTIWYEAVPSELELVNDTGGREEAALGRVERLIDSWREKALLDTLRKAMALLPPAQARRLRSEYQAQVSGGPR